MPPRWTEAYRTLGDMEVLREISATVVFRYCDGTGKELCTITVTPDML